MREVDFFFGFFITASLACHPHRFNGEADSIVKHFTAKGRSVPLWFWRTASGAEVDLLIERGGRFTAIEAKFTERPERSDLKGLEALETFYGPNSLANGIIACRAARTYKMTARVSAVPVKKIDQHLG
ncbi:MAG: hypothetical protein PVI34_03140 [Desulfobacterales bacterium]